LISITFAKGLYAVSVICSLVLAAIISAEVLVILIGLNLLLLLYSTNLKKIILLSNFVVAFATAFPLVLGGIVVNNFMGGLIAAGFAFFTNFIREIIKDVEDIKGDSSEGVQTFPQKVGIDKSIYFVTVLLVLLIILDTFPFLFHIYNAEYFVIIMVVVNPIFVYIIKLIKLSMVIGLIAILIGAQ
jgi:geranylgeranylglycerol-phosphate geranylgeranyltransferase